MTPATPAVDRPPTLCAEDLMVRHPETTHPNVLATDAVQQMLRTGVQGLPVVDSSRSLRGIITLTDCLTLVSMNQHPPGMGSARVNDLMTTNVHHVLPNTDLLSIAHMLQKHPWHMLPVLDQNTLVGTMTGQEVLKGLSRLRNLSHIDRGRSFPDYARPSAHM